MLKKSKREWVIILFVFGLPVIIQFFIWLKQDITLDDIFSNFIIMDSEEVYEPIPLFDELYSTFWSGYLNLPFTDRGWIGYITLITLCVIGFILIRKIPAILQWTLLPIFYIATYEFMWTSKNHVSRLASNGVFQIMSNDMMLSGFVNMLFTLICFMLWGGLIIMVIIPLLFSFGGVVGAVGGAVAQEQSRAEREEYIKNLRNKKSHLESEQKSIITSNTVFGIPTGNNLSPSELEHNRRRYNRLSKEIEEIEDTLKKLNDK